MLGLPEEDVEFPDRVAQFVDSKKRIIDFVIMYHVEANRMIVIRKIIIV